MRSAEGPALAWLPGAVLAVLALMRGWLEVSMARHMAIELPLLLVLGIAAAALAGRDAQDFAGWNRRGLPGLVAATAITSYWMLPVALDIAVLDARWSVAKVASMILAGVACGMSWPRAGVVLQAFFAINWSAMTLVAGLLYQDAPQQLCSVYLADQQGVAGHALVVFAVAGLAAWMVSVVRRLGRDEAGPRI
ncbi:hypothetical protein LMG23992_01708 [Cupriavidus laharis]|uniref:Transmembrane protein n=1 Tax=Cupriavidus laharis TaxID=151654 RepID=A0ABM8WT63_9BURK|nr:hypothetical protein [Cupriavidus laharis]CAG9170666.1 hypothetical protein LMG23992_01708 [Cupriavidus laharis]